MWILDRQRYGNFLKAYVICFVSLIGLYVVIDAFENLDEFAKRSDGTLDMLRNMGRFYLVHSTLFYDRLCGVIGMMAAIFTVTWMQKSNELIAMLAAGISTQRVIRPVLISALLVSGVAVLNQEFLMPELSEELQRQHNDDGKSNVRVSSRVDVNQIVINGKDGLRASKTVASFHATLPPDVFKRLYVLDAAQARYIPPDDPTCPLRGGWVLYDALLSPAEAKVGGELGSILVELSPKDLRDFPPPVEIKADGKAPPLTRSLRATSGYFLRTNVTFSAVTRRRDWYLLASTPELMAALSDPTSDSERLDIEVFLHGRLLRPMLGLSLMALTLPLVLGGEGRNMFINLGLSLGTSAVFYGLIFMLQYLGGNKVLSPELAAWLPLILFGTLAVARWDRIRT